MGSLLDYQLMLLRCWLPFTLSVDDFKVWAPPFTLSVDDFKVWAPPFRLSVDDFKVWAPLI